MAKRGGNLNMAVSGGLLGFIVLAIMAVFIYFLVVGKEKFGILPNSPTDPKYPGVAVAPAESQESGYVRTPAGNVYRT